MNQVTTITGILILATLAESLVEYLIRPLVKPWINGEPKLAASAAKAPTSTAKQPPPATTDRPNWRDLVLRYTAAAVGTLLAAAYDADLMAIIGLTSPWPWVGYVVTGFLIGRGANFVHDFTSRWLAPAD